MEEGERAFDKEIERRNVLQFLLLHLLSSPLPTDERDIHTRRHSLAAAHNAVTHGREGALERGRESWLGSSQAQYTIVAY